MLSRAKRNTGEPVACRRFGPDLNRDGLEVSSSFLFCVYGDLVSFSSCKSKRLVRSRHIKSRSSTFMCIVTKLKLYTVKGVCLCYCEPFHVAVNILTTAFDVLSGCVTLFC